MICPVCNGKKYAIFMAEPGSRLEREDCSTCLGTGEVTEEHGHWLEKARTLRYRRVHQGTYETIRDMAKRLGIPWLDLAHMEGGDVAAWEKHGHLVERE